MVLWFQGFMISWFCGFRVLWFYGFVVLWFYGFMALWFYGFMVLWCCGLWFGGFVVLCFYVFKKYQIMSSGRYWFHITNFRDLFRRIFIISRCPSFPKLSDLYIPKISRFKMLNVSIFPSCFEVFLKKEEKRRGRCLIDFCWFLALSLNF